ncbi:transcription initiation factor TFIID component TAF4 family-domain-containing protein [Dichomitus squalens]|uniref:Transcription initiation factor TFIID subunit 4 n=1 Tax=Dichomitus squalens TaxID=114155 RepID=A0A4Q9PW22_9APHY|nr:transcription initiation factor TFIID component TAF4 family-domain-containing protein [Dichomitus squalens]TBU58676.1 transcription initiation factor TFIID component TAF4 family-domain-containing protein [Dichomitus squalens]
MKAEDSQQSPPTTTTFSAATWPTAKIPIDPALQQQSQHPQHTATTPYSHYQYGHYQTNYSHYPQYTQQTHQTQTAPATQAQAHVQTPQVAQTNVSTVVRPLAQAVPQTQTQSQSGVDTTDVATLNDALGSAGVDLRAEEETLQRTNDQYYSYRPYEDRSRKQPDKPHFDTMYLGSKMRATGTTHKVSTVSKESIDYVALALRFRLQGLITAMIAAARHRTDTQFDRPPSTYEDGTPMWSIKVRSDVGKQLEALQKAYREEDMKERRERKERQDAQAAQAAALTTTASGAGTDGAAADGEDGGGPKKKKKKDGPGVTARNMSEDVRKKMSNAVASQAAGLGTGKYAWMSAASAATAAPPKPKPAVAARASTPATTTTPAASSTSAGGWARPYQPKSASQQAQKDDDGRLAVTLRDAVFVVNNEKGHGGGRGAARGWT